MECPWQCGNGPYLQSWLQFSAHFRCRLRRGGGGKWGLLPISAGATVTSDVGGGWVFLLPPPRITSQWVTGGDSRSPRVWGEIGGKVYCHQCGISGYVYSLDLRIGGGCNPISGRDLPASITLRESLSPAASICHLLLLGQCSKRLQDLSLDELSMCTGRAHLSETILFAGAFLLEH